MSGLVLHRLAQCVTEARAGYDDEHTEILRLREVQTEETALAQSGVAGRLLRGDAVGRVGAHLPLDVVGAAELPGEQFKGEVRHAHRPLVVLDDGEESLAVGRVDDVVLKVVAAGRHNVLAGEGAVECDVEVGDGQEVIEEHPLVGRRIAVEVESGIARPRRQLGTAVDGRHVDALERRLQLVGDLLVGFLGVAGVAETVHALADDARVAAAGHDEVGELGDVEKLVVPQRLKQLEIAVRQEKHPSPPPRV